MDWFKSYFDARKQYIEADNIISEMEETIDGIPQEGVLAATLFIIYLNEIKNLNLHAEKYLYADDIALVYNEKNLNELTISANEDMNKIKKFMDSHKLTINTSKTKIMYIKEKTNTSSNIMYNNQMIETVTEFNYLGVLMDNNLNWKKTLNSLKKQNFTNGRNSS